MNLSPPSLLQSVKLHVSTKNDGAIAFYERVGFTDHQRIMYRPLAAAAMPLTPSPGGHSGSARL